MAVKNTAKRISSLFSFTPFKEPKVDTRSFSEPSPVLPPGEMLSPTQLLPPQASDRTSSPPASGSLAPPSPFAEARPASPRGRASSPFSSDARRSWRSRSQASSPKGVPAGPLYWIVFGDSTVSYDVTALTHSQKASELWDDDGDALVYLWPRSMNKPPSFRVSSSLFSSSASLASLAHGLSYEGPRNSSPQGSVKDLHFRRSASSSTSPDVEDRDSRGACASPEPETPSQEVNLYFPVSFHANSHGDHTTVSDGQPSPELVEELVSIRNLFAFLARRPLVFSRRSPTLFSVFMKIADLLEDLKFSNLDHSTFGEVSLSSFKFYMDDYQLADCRLSLEKTIEGVILGERMRCFELYNEAFVHAVGKYGALKKLGHPYFESISRTTRNRMERSYMELEIRTRSVQARLTDFEFPSLFAGIANSTTSDESKTVHFKAWKSSFSAFRKHVMGYYKQLLGSWPPKANSKKNDFEESGLNRVVLQLLYQDMSDLYDLLVDRTSLTSRSADLPSLATGEVTPESEEPTPRALRRIMSEYDRSSPPVQPPIPFDTPRLPSQSFDSLSIDAGTKKQGTDAPRRLRGQEVDTALRESYNQELMKPTPFISAFMLFEKKAAQNKTLHEICDQRNGYWIFLYAILQSLPLLVIDAPDIKWTEGVEYFLCEMPKGGLPWSKEDSNRKKSWYGIPGGTALVNLPSDIVDHGVEGIYRRSHCWTAAEQWTHQHEEIPAPPPATVYRGTSSSSVITSTSGGTSSPSPLSPPIRPRGNSNRLSAVALGLEALPVPAGVSPDLQAVPRQTATHHPTKSFEDILPEPPNQRGKKWWNGI